MRRSFLVCLAGTGLLLLAGAVAYRRSQQSVAWATLPVESAQSTMLPAAPPQPQPQVLPAPPPPAPLPFPSPVLAPTPSPTPPLKLAPSPVTVAPVQVQQATPTIRPTIAPVAQGADSSPGSGAPTPGLSNLTAKQIDTCNGTPASAYFRSSPSLERSAIIGSVRRGSTVYLTGMTQPGDGLRWYEVRLESGQSGWIASCFING
jgi:hypothetical protein